MIRIARWATVAALTLMCAATVVEARGGGGGGGGGGGRGGGGGGGRGGGGPGNIGGRGFGGPGGMGAGAGVNMGAGRFTGGSKGNNSEQALAELEDRKRMIAERRSRLGDGDRAANQELRLAAARLAAADDRSGDDVR